jgi:predicted phosphoribosyltransferase
MDRLGSNTIVLALPRGGVPVGVGVAEALNAPLDIVVVRKLGVPWQPELAMGAIAGRTRVLDEQLVRALRISNEEIETVVANESREMERRERLYRAGLPATDLHGRIAILVDDGLATGSTMVAATRHVRGFYPQKIIVAVPVASRQAWTRMQREADECVCLELPEPFDAVGQWYVDFRQVTDVEVRELLRRSSSSLQSVL